MKCYICKALISYTYDKNGKLKSDIGVGIRSRKFCFNCGWPLLLRLKKILI